MGSSHFGSVDKPAPYSPGGRLQCRHQGLEAHLLQGNDDAEGSYRVFLAVKHGNRDSHVPGSITPASWAYP